MCILKPQQSLIFHWFRLKFVLNIQETWTKLGNMYLFKYLPLNGYSNQINNQAIISCNLHISRNPVKNWLNRYQTDRKPWSQLSTNAYWWYETAEFDVTASENDKNKRKQCL